MLPPDKLSELRSLPMEKAILYWDAVESEGRKSGKLPQAVRLLCLSDLFYLLVRVCGRKDMLNEFAFARCREVEESPDGHLGLWAREHWKSSIITFGLTIQDVLKESEITFGIFSHTRPIAKAFLRQIMREFETNQKLQLAFPDILWGNDLKQAQKWSEDDGLIVRRKSNPNEATIEAWGLVDGQPVSKHFKVLLYDDIVVQASVSTPEMISKTMSRMEESYSLGTATGKRRFAGTRWHFNDAYGTIAERKTAVVREHPGRIGGTEDGESVFWTEDVHRRKRRDMGPYVYSAQVLLRPKADALQGFKREWLRTYQTIKMEELNWYLLFDAANSKKRSSDYTAGWAVGLGRDENYYCIPIVRDRLNLKERGDRVFEAHRKYKPKQVRYEKYGMMADIEHLHSRMEYENYRFGITEVGGQTSKSDRIKRLIPLFVAGRIWLPESMYVTNWVRTPIDLVRSFIEEEYMAFPVGMHEDGLDSLSRICEPDLTLIWPMEKKKETGRQSPSYNNQHVGWMG